MKVIVAGGRDFTDYEYLSNSLKTKLGEIYLDQYNPRSDYIEIVSGGARGADALGEKFAEEYKLPVKLFPADWEQYGKSAGAIRNRQMAEYADMLIAFWDGSSKGTKNMIETMKKLGKPTFIYSTNRS